MTVVIRALQVLMLPVAVCRRAHLNHPSAMFCGVCGCWLGPEREQ